MGKVISDEMAKQYKFDRLIEDGYEVRAHFDDYGTRRFIVYKDNEFVKYFDEPVHEVDIYNAFPVIIENDGGPQVDEPEVESEPESEGNSEGQPEVESESESESESNQDESSSESSAENDEGSASDEETSEAEGSVEVSEDDVAKLTERINDSNVADVNSMIDELAEREDWDQVELVGKIESENKDRSGSSSHVDYWLDNKEN